MALRKAVFFDRDGTLNVDEGYVHRREDWQWMPGAREAIRLARASGYLVIVVTNQSGIARGMYTPAEVENLHQWVASQVVGIDAFYYCPHGPSDRCDCRKPRPGMLLSAIGDWSLDPRQCLLLGDADRDVEAAKAAGVRGYRYGGGDLADFLRPLLNV